MSFKSTQGPIQMGHGMAWRFLVTMLPLMTDSASVPGSSAKTRSTSHRSRVKWGWHSLTGGGRQDFEERTVFNHSQRVRRQKERRWCTSGLLLPFQSVNVYNFQAYMWLDFRHALLNSCSPTTIYLRRLNKLAAAGTHSMRWQSHMFSYGKISRHKNGFTSWIHIQANCGWNL